MKTNVVLALMGGLVVELIMVHLFVLAIMLKDCGPDNGAEQQAAVLAQRLEAVADSLQANLDTLQAEVVAGIVVQQLLPELRNLRVKVAVIEQRLDLGR